MNLNFIFIINRAYAIQWGQLKTTHVRLLSSAYLFFVFAAEKTPDYEEPRFSYCRNRGISQRKIIPPLSAFDPVSACTKVFREV